MGMISTRRASLALRRPPEDRAGPKGGVSGRMVGRRLVEARRMWLMASMVPVAETWNVSMILDAVESAVADRTRRPAEDPRERARPADAGSEIGRKAWLSPTDMQWKFTAEPRRTRPAFDQHVNTAATPCGTARADPRDRWHPSCRGRTHQPRLMIGGTPARTRSEAGPANWMRSIVSQAQHRSPAAESKVRPSQ